MPQDATAPSPLDYDRRSAQLVRVVGRLWRAAEDWVIQSSDLNRQDSIRIIRSIERLRGDARRTDPAHLEHLRRELLALEQLLATARVPAEISGLVDGAQQEVLRLQREDEWPPGEQPSKAGGAPPAPAGGSRPASGTALPASSRAAILPWPRARHAEWILAGVAVLAGLGLGWRFLADPTRPLPSASAADATPPVERPSAPARPALTDAQN